MQLQEMLPHRNAKGNSVTGQVSDGQRSAKEVIMLEIVLLIYCMILSWTKKIIVQNETL